MTMDRRLPKVTFDISRYPSGEMLLMSLSSSVSSILPRISTLKLLKPSRLIVIRDVLLELVISTCAGRRNGTRIRAERKKYFCKGVILLRFVHTTMRRWGKDSILAKGMD